MIGSGPAGSLIANRLANRGAEVIVLESGPEFTPSGIVGGLFQYYQNAGIVPMVGPFTGSFGQANVVGGGSVINGALVWPTPSETIKKWRDSLPGSVYSSKTWRSTEQLVADELRVDTTDLIHKPGNRLSKLLVSAATNKQLHTVPVPRAVTNCKNSNICGSGCPVGAKNIPSSVYLNHPKITLFPNTRVDRITPENQDGVAWNIRGTNAGAPLNFSAEKVFIAAGATASSSILKKSGLSQQAGRRFEFHLNFRIVAEFDESVEAEISTMLTHQVQEYLDDGLLMMSSNGALPYLGSALAHLDNASIYKLMNLKPECLGLFVLMLKPKLTRSSLYDFLGQTFCRWDWEYESFEKVKFGLNLLGSLLFEMGARQLVFPFKTNHPLISSQKEMEQTMQHLKPKDLLGVSVHGMSSCRMGIDPSSSVVNLDGQVWGYDNLYVVDSSILPSNTGESPQGTILATAHELFQRNFD